MDRQQQQQDRRHALRELDQERHLHRIALLEAAEDPAKGPTRDEVEQNARARELEAADAWARWVVSQRMAKELRELAATIAHHNAHSHPPFRGKTVMYSPPDSFFNQRHTIDGRCVCVDWPVERIRREWVSTTAILLSLYHWGSRIFQSSLIRPV